jgi:stage II sporulation protein R
MKKILFLIGILIIMYILNVDEYNMSDDTIRFRVIANSNSEKDIIMKELVVSELSDILFIKTDSLEETKKNIYSNLEKIDYRISSLFKKNNYNMQYNILYGMNEFPKKEFMNKTYEEGLYDSLVIEIGEAKGNNYFCILYPSLCMIDYNEKSEYKSKIVEIFNSIF